MEIFSTDQFELDLERIRAECFANKLPDDSSVIEAFLEHIANNVDAMWDLTKWKIYHGSFPVFNVSAIIFFQESGYNIYRCRPFFQKLGKYRIIYAYDGQHDEIHLMALVVKKPDELPKEIILEEFYGYEPLHPTSKRICEEYDRIGLPKLN